MKLLLVLLLVLLSSCEPLLKKPEKKEEKAAPAATVTGKRADCYARKKPLMRACVPVCENLPEEVTGAAFDACLQDCAKKQFGRGIPMCAELPE